MDTPGLLLALQLAGRIPSVARAVGHNDSPAHWVTFVITHTCH